MSVRWCGFHHRAFIPRRNNPRCPVCGNPKTEELEMKAGAKRKTRRGETSPTSAETNSRRSESHGGTQQMLPLAKIEVAGNPRKQFDPAELESLAESIKQHGVLQPLLVREHEGHYFLAAGGRRLLAAEMAFLAEVPCLVRTMTDQEFADVQLVENLQRANLNPLEEADAFFLATRDGGGRYTQQELADKLGVTQSHVAHRLSLRKLPPEAAKLVRTGALPPTHARSLLSLLPYPKILAKTLRRWEPETPLKSWERMVNEELRNGTRSVAFGQYLGPKFKMTPDVKRELAIIDVPNPWGKGSEPRATNVALWDKLQRQAVAEAKSVPAKSAKKTTAQGKDRPGGDATPDLTDLEFGTALHRHKVRWSLREISARLAPAEEVADDQLWRIWMILAIYVDLSGVPAEIMRMMASGQVSSEPSAEDVCAAVRGVRETGWIDFVRAVTHAVLANEDEYLWPNGAAVLSACRQILGVTFADFVADREFLEPWSAARLRELVRRETCFAGLRLFAEGRGEDSLEHEHRAALVELLVEHWPRGFVPREWETVNHAGEFESGAAEIPAPPAKKTRRGAKRS